MDNVALTDDEVVGLAALATTSWLSPLPTLGAAGASALAAAASRGVRSLLVRELADAAADAPPILGDEFGRLVAPLVEHRVALSVFVTRDGKSVEPNGTLVFHYSAGDGTWRTEVISPAGVHYIAVSDAADCRTVTTVMLEQAFANGLVGPDAEDPVEPLYLCIGGPSSGEPTLVLARRGELLVKRLDRDSNVMVDRGAPASPAEALSTLVESL